MTARLTNDLSPEESFAAWGRRRQEVPRWRETIMTDAPEPIELEEDETLVAVIREDGEVLVEPHLCKVCHTIIEFQRPGWTHSLVGADDHPVELVDADRSNLVEHARRELELLGEDPMMTEAILDLLAVLASQGHSGFSAAYTVERFRQLAAFKNLTPLTPDPTEWIDREGGLWQSARCSDAFSLDGGLTYYRLGEDKRGDDDALIRTFHRTTS